MNSDEIYEFLERIANLIRTDVRRGGTGSRLQPVQIEALHYLGRCNRYSNTPLAVADFLGLTKGTVSQTLRVLEVNGLIEKQTDPRDRRVVHLVVTPEGREVLLGTVPPQVFKAAFGGMAAAEREAMLRVFDGLLRRLQRANGLRSFGACKSCRHHRVEAVGSRRCGLTHETLTDLDAEKICREHESPAPSGQPAGPL